MSQNSVVRRPGRQVVFGLYAAVVSVAGIMGLILGLIHPEGMDPTLFGVIDLPANPLGMMLFGVITIGLGLGVLLAVVAVVADRYDDAGPKA